MNLLERLEQEQPRSKTRGRSSKVYALVLEHFDELQEARKKGYTWPQIINCAKEAWADQINWNGSKWNNSNYIDNYFYRIRKEKKS